MRRYLFVVFMLGSFGLYGQLPSDIIIIEGNVIELSSDSEFHLVSDFPLVINQSIKFQCDKDGSFSVRIPYHSDQLRIDLEKSEYQVIQPKDGNHYIESKVVPNTKYSMLIVIVSDGIDETLRKQLIDAQKEVDRLKSKNLYTNRQLQSLNKKLIDSIQVYQSRFKSFEKSIAQLEGDNQNLKKSSAAHTDTIEQLRQELLNIREDNAVLITKLSAAMEERYLKQKAQFESISTNLRLYTSRVKDLRDHLRLLESLVKSGKTTYYYKTLDNYNESYEEMEGSRDEYKNSIQHYWESDRLSQEYTDLENLIINEIHKKDLLTLNNTVNAELQKASMGKKLKMKALKKQASSSVASLNIKIENLESKVNHFLEELVIF